MSSNTNNDEVLLGDDLLDGARSIAKEIKQSVRQTYYLLQTGQLPATKLGPKRWIASRRALRERLTTPTNIPATKE